MDPKRTDKTKLKTSSALKSALLFLAMILIVACSPATRQLFFDIPPPEPESEPEQVTEPSQAATRSPAGNFVGPVSGLGGVHPNDLETDRPPTEGTLVWEEALELLPRDNKDHPDWTAALRDGVVKPRALDPADRGGEWFKLDFFLQAKNPRFDTWFPHSAHLEWMGCDSCHPAVFKYRDNDITMASIRKGEYCGACHGTVAFPANNCKRCHTAMP